MADEIITASMRQTSILSKDEMNSLRQSELSKIFRIGISPIKDIDTVIEILENSLFAMDELSIADEDKEIFNPYLQAMIDDIFDVIDYLKNIRKDV